MIENEKLNELGTKPIGPLLMQYAFPAIIAMAASSLYNIVDGIFIGQGVGPLALMGLGLTMPLMSLTAAFGAMVGVGAATLLSVKLGERDYDTARHILGNVITMDIGLGIGLGLVLLLFLDPILYFFGASEETIPYARDFMRIILAGNVVTHLYMGLNALLRSTSKPRQAMYATILTVVINILLAPLFIYVFHWGIEGAALATILGQTIVLCWQFRLFGNPNELIHLRRGTYRLQKRIVKGTLAIGLSPFLINLCSCMIIIILNRSMVRYGGDIAVGAVGIVNRLVFLFVMTVIGINQGMQPIAGYNYGARNYDRLLQVLRKAIGFATLITTMGFFIGVFLPTPCARAFTDDPELIRQSAWGMRITFLLFPLIGMQIVTVSFFQSIGHASMSIILSLTRQLLFLLPMLIVLPHFWGLDGVWYSMPASDSIACLVAFVCLLREIRRLKQKQLETHHTL